MNAVPAALIGILLSSVAVGLAQEEGTTAQPPQVVFSMMRDVAGEVKSPRRVRLEGAVDSADLHGCHDPAAIEWQPLAGFTAERAVVLRRHHRGRHDVLVLAAPSGREEITVRRRIALAHEDARERIDIDLGSLPTLHFVGNQPGGVLRIHSIDYVSVATVPVGEDGRAMIHVPAPGEYRVHYVTRPDPDGNAESYLLYQQRLEGTQTFHIGDFVNAAELY